jgi:hypothetical protein
MCDYSLESRLSRPAVVGEKLVLSNFGTGTRGFSSVDDKAPTCTDFVAVCLLPGTELAFDAPVKVCAHYDAHDDRSALVQEHTIPHQVARFTKINPDEAFRHHDGLEFPDHVGHAPVLLTHLEVGQVATVLQMPADINAAKALDEATRAKAPEPEPVF